MNDGDRPIDPEVLPDERNGTPDPGGNDTTINATLNATLIEQLHQYTDRPDLLVAELEKHDPGFIKEMNRRAKDFSEKYQESRFKFGERQAYVSLAVSTMAALSVVAALFYLISVGQGDFWSIFGLVVFFSISQAGPSGIKRFLSQLMDTIERVRGKSDNE